jgi:hypothetical protein
VGVAVDEAGCDPTAFEVGNRGALDRPDRHFAFRADIAYAAAFDDDSAFFDDAETLLLRVERCQARVAPKMRTDLAGCVIA